MKYFAYGSNMSLARLRARVLSADRIGTYRLCAHELRFHKAGRDGSGKCDAYHTHDPEHSVIGALYEIDPIEKPRLDLAEGLGVGYEEKSVLLAAGRGVQVSAFTYVATRIDESLRPYSWYKHHVLVGARESSLPENYIGGIELVDCAVDEDKAREAMEYAIHSMTI